MNEWLKPDAKIDVSSVLLVACPWDCGAAIVDVEKHVAFHDDYRELQQENKRLVQQTCKHSWWADYNGNETCSKCDIAKEDVR